MLDQVHRTEVGYKSRGGWSLGTSRSIQTSIRSWNLPSNWRHIVKRWEQLDPDGQVYSCYNAHLGNWHISQFSEIWSYKGVFFATGYGWKSNPKRIANLWALCDRNQTIFKVYTNKWSVHTYKHMSFLIQNVSFWIQIGYLTQEIDGNCVCVWSSVPPKRRTSIWSYPAIGYPKISTRLNCKVENHPICGPPYFLLFSSCYSSIRTSQEYPLINYRPWYHK